MRFFQPPGASAYADDLPVDPADVARLVASLRAQADFGQRLIDSSDDCIKILDLDARLVAMSPNGQRSLRIMNVEAVIGTSWIEFWRGDDRAHARAAIAQALAGGTGRFTGYFPVEDEPRWFDVVITAIPDASGRPENLLAVSRDVTVAREATAALAESERRYRGLAEAMPGLTWTASAAGEIDFVTANWSDVHGDDRERAMGNAWFDFLHPDDVDDVRTRWFAAIAAGEPFELVMRARQADGEYRWQLARAQPLRAADGAIARWIGVTIDVDEQRQADDARQRFVALAESSSDFIGITDPDGAVVYVNEAGRKLLEIGTLDDAQATRLFDYFLPDDYDAVRADILPAVERDGRWIGDFRFRNFRTGAAVPVAYTLFRFSDRKGRFGGYATVSRDRRASDRVDAGLRLLARTGAARFDALDDDATVRSFADAFVPDFASYCIIDAIPGAGGRRRTVVHPDPATAAALLAVPEPAPPDPFGRALADGASSRFESDGTWIAGCAARGSVICVPIVLANGEIAGAIACGRDAAGRRAAFVDDDVAFVEEVGRRAGAAIANVRMYERERRIAVELQAASLPASVPQVGHVHVDADYRPGSNEATIGGDWYDAFELADGRVAMTLGDVVGHGLAAAVMMTKLRQAMQTAAMIDPNPNVMLGVADRTLRLLDGDAYATALAAIYDGRAGTLTFASAGHPGPRMRLPDGQIFEHTSPGLMLGLRTGRETELAVVDAPRGSIAIFYTDGLVESTRDIDAGYARLDAALRRPDVIGSDRPARAIVEAVLAGAPASDDVAVLVARMEGFADA